MFKDVKDMNKELKDALQKHYELCYCYGCKNNPERCHCAFKSFMMGMPRMTWDWHWISWFKGQPFQWGDFRYNSGDPYKSYRFGPLLIRVFMR